MVKPTGGSLEPELVRRIESYGSSRSCIEALFLFGSVARGEARPGSDVDIGVLFTHGTKPAGLEVLQLNHDLNELLQRDDVQVVSLNDAPALLLHRVARDGHVLYAKTNRAVAEFYIYALQQYEDTRRLRQMQAELLDRRLTSREPLGVVE